MKIKEMPKQNRPRERFLKLGPEALSDSELFAILLRTGIKGENVIDMSNRLIAEYGLNKIFECSLRELEKIKGIGPSKAMQILVMKEILKRVGLAEIPILKIKKAEDVFNLYHEEFKGDNQEYFIVLMLNNQNNILGKQEVSKGSLNMTLIDSREVFKSPIKNSAAKIILVHNHPGGDSSPSEEDLLVFGRLKEASEQLGIKIVDFVIIGERGYWSWLEKR